MLRRIAIPLMLLQLASPGARAGDAGAAGALEIVEETRWVRSGDALRKACGRTDDIRACTQLAAELKAGPCSGTSKSWRLHDPKVRVVAVRILVGPSREPFNDLTVQHEANHVSDFRKGLAGYLEELSNREFASERACIAAGESAMKGFDARMRQIAAASNRKLHAQRPAARTAESRP